MEIENGADDEGAQQQPPQAAPIGNLAFAFQNFLNNLHVQFGQNPENGVDSSSDESDSDDEGSASDEDENGLFQRLIGAANPRRERADASGKFDFILSGTDDDGLFYHVRAGNVAQVRQTLERYAGPDSEFPVADFINLRESTKHRDTLLAAAVRKGHVDVVKLLLEYKADAEVIVNPDRFSLLHLAVRKSHVNIVELLLKRKEDGGGGLDVARTALADWQPLHYAGFDERRDDAVVLCLLNHGADPNATVNDGRSSLHLMSGAKRLQRLIEAGGDVNLADQAGNTPVFVHAQRGDLECVKALVEGGALVNVVNMHGETPFNVLTSNRWEVALYLWEHGGAPSAVRKFDGLDDLRWFRRRLKPNLKVPALNFTPRVRSGIAAINGVVYVCGGMGYSSLINDTENRAPWNQRTTQLSDIWAFDLNDESDALLVPRSYSFKKHAENRLDRTHASTNLIIGDDGLTVTYDGPSSSPSGVFAMHPVKRSDDFAYFEMTVLDGGESNIIALGFVPEGYKLHDFPGWRKGSYGYHGDDGSSFHNCGSGSMFGPRYTTNDIAGVGINFKSGEVFYTLNGEFVGVAYRVPPENVFYPMISLNSNGESLRANFGQKPFAFNFDAPVLSAQMIFEAPMPLGECLVFVLDEKRILLLPARAPAKVFDIQRRELIETALRFPDSTCHPFLVDRRLFILYQSSTPFMEPGFNSTDGNPVDKTLVEVNVIDLPENDKDEDAWRELTWTLAKVPSGFVPYSGQSMAQAGKKIYVWGSPRHEDASLVHVFDTETLEWSERHMQGTAPLIRADSNTLTTVGDEILSFGGFTKSKKISNDLDVLDTRTLTWYKPHLTGTVPRGRMDQAAVVASTNNGAEYVLLGGWNGRNHIDDVDFLELHKPDVASNFSVILNSEEFADIHFVFADSTVLPGHAPIIAARSAELRELIMSGHDARLKRIQINDASTDLFLSLLRYLYTDSLDMAAIGARVRDFLALVQRYASQHHSRITQSLLLTRVITGSSFSHDLAWALNDRNFTDVTLIVNGKRFPAHKCILCTRAGYFKALLSGGLKESSLSEVELKEVDERPFVAVLRHIYTRSIDLDEVADDLLDVFVAASRFDVGDLKAHLEAVIQHNLSIENVVSLLQLADQENASKLRRSCVRFIQGHQDEVVSDPQWSEVEHLIPK